MRTHKHTCLLMQWVLGGMCKQYTYIVCLSVLQCTLWVCIVSVSSPVNSAGVSTHVWWVFMCMFVCLRECADVLYIYTCKHIGRYPKWNTEEALAPDQYLNHNLFLKSGRDRREFLRARLILMKS